MVVNIPKSFREEELTNGYLIRRTAADFSVPLITNIQMAQRFVEALKYVKGQGLAIKSWNEYTIH